jgi:hypothetical protein
MRIQNRYLKLLKVSLASWEGKAGAYAKYGNKTLLELSNYQINRYRILIQEYNK